MVGVEIPASGNASPPGVGETADIAPVVGVGVFVGVGSPPPVGGSVGVGVEVVVVVGVGVLVTVPVGVGVGELPVVRVNANCWQATGLIPRASGWLSGAVGATASCLS